VIFSYHPDQQPPLFILAARRKHHSIRIQPQPLNVDEVDAMLELVREALGLVEFEADDFSTRTDNSIETIPFLA
jgi:hypothetical protein